MSFRDMSNAVCPQSCYTLLVSTTNLCDIVAAIYLVLAEHCESMEPNCVSLYPSPKARAATSS